jgi:hypothetical protein
VVVALGVDTCRMGFFADDFHFLDVARRVPLGSALLGQYGIWPWLRPLSRELFFGVIVGAGPAGLALAHACSLASVFACAALQWRVGRRLVGPVAAGIGAALFVTYGFTKFLVAWASGFQDLLALLLILAALDALLAGRRSLALLWAVLAPFAKESAFIVFPLLVAFAYGAGGTRPSRGWLVRLSALFGGALVLHALARWTWHSTGAPLHGALETGRLPDMLAQVLAAFVTQPNSPNATSIVLAVVAGIVALWLLRSASAIPLPARPLGRLPAARGAALVALAVALGLAPAIAGRLVSLAVGHAYHAFPAVPWIALLLGLAIARLPRRAWIITVPLLVAVNVCGLGYLAPELDRAEPWAGGTRWDWPAAVRIDAIARRFTHDVREQLAGRPDSVVVLFEGLPLGSFFQTEDGPAVREALGDAHARAYWINDPPPDVRGHQLAILTFDSDRQHLRRTHWSTATALQRATNALLARRAAAADAFAQFEAAPDSARSERAYLRAGAALLAHGPDAFARALADAGLADSLDAAPPARTALVAALPREVAAVHAAMWRRPLTAGAHVALAESLLAYGLAERGALELRIATLLDPERWRDRYHLASVLVQLGGAIEAVADFREIAASPSAGAMANLARVAIAQLEHDIALDAPAPMSGSTSAAP